MVGDTDRDRAYLMALSASNAFGHSSEPAHAFAGRIAESGTTRGGLMAHSGRWYARSWWTGATVCAAATLCVLVASMATARALSPTPPDPDFVPGEILMKLKSAVPLPHPSGGGAASSAALSSRTSLDALFARHAVSGTARVFSGAKAPRAGRRLRLKGQTIGAPDLTRVYKLTLGPGLGELCLPGPTQHHTCRRTDG